MQLTPEQRALIQSGRMVIRAKHWFDFTKRHCAVIDALVMESLSQGERSVVIPSNLTLHELSGVPPQHIPTVLTDLEACRVIQTAETPDGMRRFRVNTDPESWRIRPTVAVQTSRAARALVAQINGRDSDETPPSMKAVIPNFDLYDSGAGTGKAAGASLEFPTSFITKSSL